MRVARFSCSFEVSEWLFPPFYLPVGVLENSLTRAIGTGISLYGRTGVGGAVLHLLFDGVWQKAVPLSSNNPTNSTLLWHLEGQSDGDHQLFGSTYLTEGQLVANIWLDYVE